jgi:hypothetical protein
MKCIFGLWPGEPGERFPTAFDRVVYLLACAIRCSKLIKYHSCNRWRLLPRFGRVKCVKPQLVWREMVIGRYGFSWLKETKR